MSTSHRYKRVYAPGICCRRIDDEKNVIVECIYEPPQSATADSLQLERGTEEEQRADYIADLLG